MIYFVLIFGVVGLIFGTAPVTKDNIRTLAAEKTTFEVNKPFQQVFANMMSASKQCYLYKHTREQMTVAGEKNNRDKTANIRIEHIYAMKPHEMYIMVDVKSLTDNKTQVDVYNKDESAKDSLKNYQIWATKKPDKC